MGMVIMSDLKDLQAKLWAGLGESMKRMAAINEAQKKKFIDRLDSGELTNRDTVTFRRPSPYVSPSKGEQEDDHNE